MENCRQIIPSKETPCMPFHPPTTNTNLKGILKYFCNVVIPFFLSQSKNNTMDLFWYGKRKFVSFLVCIIAIIVVKKNL